MSFFFKNVFNKNLSVKLICVIAQSDKVEPLSRGSELSNEQKRNLEIKELEIKNKPFLAFNDLPVIHVSSHLNINVEKLKDEIIKKINSMKEIS